MVKGGNEIIGLNTGKDHIKERFSRSIERKEEKGGARKELARYTLLLEVKWSSSDFFLLFWCGS